MATATEPKATKVRAAKGRRLTIVFDGKYDALYTQIEKLALADDRDMDTWILRYLTQSLSAAPATT